jgi:preprotein translocase subunit SecD
MLHFPVWKQWMVLTVCLLAVYLALPNFIPAMQEAETKFVPSNTLNLGLDLQGGSHLLLEVDSNQYMREQIEALLDDVRSTLVKEKIGYRRLRVEEGEVRFELRDLYRVEVASDVLQALDPRFEVEWLDDQFSMRFTPQSKIETLTQLIEQSIEIVRRRVDETGTREPAIQRQGDQRILLQVPGLQDPERLKELLGKTARLTFHMVDESVRPTSALAKNIPAGSRVLAYEETIDGGDQRQFIAVKRRAMLSGDMLVSAHATFEGGSPVVAFRFNSQGAKKFGGITQKSVDKRFAIVLDNKVISAPVIREPILSGSGIISGSFTVESARDLALLLRAGALPAPLEVVEERTIGPTLGADSIAAGKKASLLGLALVVLFMFLTYGLFGMFSNAALLMNMVLILAGLSLFQATLTLPGIAGIVLTMGMAVDANVLIFERINEEIRLGKTVMAAVDHGFQRAFKTILDSNLTTLIAAFLLYYFGSGAIKGFAVTLSIGILASMFSAILLTRMMVVYYIKRKRPTSLSI